MPKKIVNVWFNDGRWLTKCPVCTSNTRIKLEANAEKLTIKWYCGRCYPGKIQRVLKKGIAGELSYGHSRALQMRAAGDAFSNDDIHEAVFPSDWMEAERLLRMRRLDNQHYRPHEILKRTGKPETAADLALENEKDPLLAYLRVEKKEKPAGKEPVEVEQKVRKPVPQELYKELQ